MAVRSYQFVVGPETSTLPTVGTPSADADTINKGYADKTYTRGVADLATLKAIGASSRSDLQSVYVRSLDAYFQFNSGSSATGNDISVVTPTAGTGRWLRVKDADRDSWYDTQADVASVKALDTTERQHGQTLFVQSLTKLFYFDSASATAGDDVTVIAPTSGTGRWLQMPAPASANQYAAIVANPAIAGFSTHTTIGDAITAASAGDKILVTQGTYAENVSVSKQLDLEGLGYTTVINGTVTFTNASDKSIMRGFRIQNNITFDSGADQIMLLESHVDSSVTITDNGDGNLILLIQA
jgi:hypothetical protein